MTTRVLDLMQKHLVSVCSANMSIALPQQCKVKPCMKEQTASDNAADVRPAHQVWVSRASVNVDSKDHSVADCLFADEECESSSECCADLKCRSSRCTSGALSE